MSHPMAKELSILALVSQRKSCGQVKPSPQSDDVHACSILNVWLGVQLFLFGGGGGVCVCGLRAFFSVKCVYPKSRFHLVWCLGGRVDTPKHVCICTNCL